MDFSIPEDTRLMLDLIREFMEKEVYPLEQHFLNEPPEVFQPRLDALREKVKQMGLWAPAQPKEYGGMELPLTDFALVS